MLVAHELSTRLVYAKPTLGTGTMTNVICMLLPQDAVSVILNVSGYTHIGHIGDGDDVLKVTPLANQ